MDAETKFLLWGIALGIAALNEERNTDAAVDNKSTMENFLEAAWRTATHTKEELDNQIAIAAECVEQRPRDFNNGEIDFTEGVMARLANVKDAVQPESVWQEGDPVVTDDDLERYAARWYSGDIRQARFALNMPDPNSPFPGWMGCR